ncbi:MAG TPA: SAF domain-containing protein [Bellilinea sp.]|nr:SAF domain-containing protein [Bellilinea sp.]
MAARGKSGGRIIILVALILILLVGAVYVWLQMQPSTPADTGQAPESEEMVDIVITTQSIPRGAEITQAAVTTIPYPSANLVQGTFITDISSVIGSRAKYDLDPAVPLTASVLIPPTGGSVASFDVPKDFVALPVPVESLTAVANALAPGDHVMVVGCMLLIDIDPDWQSRLPNAFALDTKPGELNFTNGGTTIITSKDLGPVVGRVQGEGSLNMPSYVVPSEPQRPRLVCQTVIQDAVVLRTGDYEEPQVAPVEPTAVPEGEQPVATLPPTKDSITLVVSPQDAVSLNYMMVAGIRLNMALRNPNDPNPIVTDAVTQQYLMEQKNIPLPAKLPYALEPRIDTVPTVAAPTPLP